MQSGAEADMDPKELENKQIVRLHQLLHEAKFKDPDGRHLSPAGRVSDFKCVYLNAVVDGGILQPCASPPKTAWHVPCTVIVIVKSRKYVFVSVGTSGFLHVINKIFMLFLTGEYNLRLGITKELQPDMVATHQGIASAHRPKQYPKVVINTLENRCDSPEASSQKPLRKKGKNTQHRSYFWLCSVRTQLREHWMFFPRR